MYIIAGILVILVVAYMMAKRKKAESSFEEEKDIFSSADPFGEENPTCPEGQEWMDTLPGCVDKESNFSRKAAALVEAKKRIPGTNIAYDYSYPLPQNQVDCGFGCWKLGSFCFCIKYKSERAVGKCPTGTYCTEWNMYRQCTHCSTPIQ